MKTRTLVISAAAVLMVAYLALRPSDSPSSKTTGTVDTSAELQRLRNDVRLLRNGLGHVSSRQRLQGRDSSNPTTERETPSEHDDTSTDRPTPTGRSGEEVHAAQSKLLETSMESDSDPTWTNWAERKLANIITTETVSGSSRIDIKCASSICRVTMEFDNAEHSQTAMQQLPTLVPWQANGYFRTDPETHATTVYISREGEQLPHPDPAG